MGHGKAFAIGSMFTQMRASENNVVSNGLILNLDASNASSYPGSGTSWDDLTLNNNDFSLINGPTYDSEKDGCIVTDGVNDYVESDATITETNATMSAFAYVKFTNLTAHSSGGVYRTWIFNKRPISSEPRWQIYIATAAADWTTNGFMSPSVAVGAGASSVGVVDGNALGTPPEIRNNEWHYIGFTTDGTNGGDINLYMDGVLYGTSSLSADRTIDSRDMRGAMDGWGTSFGLVGKVRNFHVYNRKLITAEVLQNYNAIK